MNLFLLLVEKASGAVQTATEGAVQTAAKPAGNPLMNLLPFVLFFVVFYVLLVIPQQRKAKKETRMRNEIEVGEKVLTNGGMIGQVVKIKEKSIVIATGKNKVEMEFVKNAIAENLTKLEARAMEKKNK